jgi:hypothetical protein
MRIQNIVQDHAYCDRASSSPEIKLRTYRCMKPGTNSLETGLKIVLHTRAAQCLFEICPLIGPPWVKAPDGDMGEHRLSSRSEPTRWLRRQQLR